MPLVKLGPVITEFPINLSNYEDESMKVYGDASYEETKALTFLKKLFFLLD